MDTMPILIDLIMMGLLVGTIIHSIHLSKSLTTFKKLHGEILPIMHEHAQNITQNITHIEQMKKISADIEHTLNSRIPKALTIKQDLEFLVSRANELADLLETTIERDRQKEVAVVRSAKIPPKNRSMMNMEIPEKQKTKSKKLAKPLTESFSLTKTAKKLFAKAKRGEGGHAV